MQRRTPERVPVRRRAVLASAGALAGALAGCLGRLGDGPGADGDGNESDPDLPPDGVAEGDHRLYLANLDDEPRTVDIVVTDGETGERVVDGTYELPDERGAEFATVAAWDRRYDVSVDVVAGGSAAFEWANGDCSGGEATDGSRNAAVRVQPGGEEVTLVVDQCDAIVAGTAVPFGPAAEFAVDG